VLAPGRAWPARVLGARLLRWGQYDEAVLVLERALALDREHVETHNALAMALAKAGKREAAERRFREAMARFPDQRRLALGLGALLVEGGQLRQALALYGDVARRWPGFAPAHVARSLLLAQLGERDAARAALAEAVRLAPQNQDYRRRLAALE
jgi:Flp pilus assembly protein TadD